MIKKPKILFYDIETTYLEARIWRLGDQYVSHSQLMARDAYDIICITYCYNDGKPAKVLDWGYEEQDSSGMLEQFDELIRDADIVIGKNNNRFDNKHLNLQRLFSDRAGMSDWTKKSDDLESQFRRHFGQALPSHSLDYISKKLKLGGKIKMEFQDWIDIVEKTPNGPRAFKKMLKYGKKDVVDTRTIWDFSVKHLSPKLNMSTFNTAKCCTTCGSKNIIKNGSHITASGKRQKYFCKDHGGNAGYEKANGLLA